MSPNQIRNAGLDALVKSLGPVGMVRFIQQYDTGSGDYVKDRVKWLDQMNLDEIIITIEKGRGKKG
ncbi:hypothetical protein DK28_0209350 [Peptococcaceae bacterium SCADC1_2_3]|jgi:hypothetical protein|nr:hypothetical protein DK28_0209350 [Peptococcaceae bacterium SCADC1_2_3]KFI35966.1 hypothetical protein HY00_10120 [Peptococcaceae bacterium SCADC1_2_3]HBQ28516.1 hypothetical protein [Desulfotomaculum sp.]